MTRREERLCFLLLGALCAAAFWACGRPVWEPLYLRARGMKTVGDVVADLGAEVESRLRPACDAAGLGYPPSRLALLVFKQEKIVELWGTDDGFWKRICHYPILGASGTSGPKLREGDLQVAEGIYRIEGPQRQQPVSPLHQARLPQRLRPGESQRRRPVEPRRRHLHPRRFEFHRMRRRGRRRYRRSVRPCRPDRTPQRQGYPCTTRFPRCRISILRPRRSPLAERTL